MECYLVQNGGISLNFKVVDGTGEPGNPKPNMIWVNTDTKITGYVFSATQPTGLPGLVWFLTGSHGNVEFNALKKNGILLRLSRAKQYISGEFIDVDAKCWQAEKWVDLDVIYYIFKEAEGAKVPFEATSQSNVSVSVDSAAISFGASSANYSYQKCYTEEKIDLDGYHTLVMDCQFFSGWSNSFGFGSSISSDSGAAQSYVASAAFPCNGTRQLCTLEIPENAGKQYLAISGNQLIGSVFNWYLIG